MSDQLSNAELPPVSKPEVPIAQKLPEVIAPEVEPLGLGKGEQKIVDRVRKDGDPDAVLQDIAKTEKPNEQVGKPEAQPVSWERVFDTPAGQEFYNAMRGIGSDGKQDVTRDRITTEYTMREFVRRYPNEAKQFGEVFQKTYGREHPDLVRAQQQIEELQKNPPSPENEDPKYAALAYRVNQDEAYQQIREKLSTAHKLKVFGTTDFSEIPLEKFADLCNSKENLSFSSDREAEIVFRKRFPDRATLYDQRENSRVYRDPDGMINRDRDPLFLAMFEPNERGVAWTREEGLRQFALRYPEKAKSYAERYLDLKPFLGEAKAVPQREVSAVSSQAVQESIVPANQGESAKPELQTETRVGKLTKDFDALGIESRVIQISNASGLTEAVILTRKEIPTEKMIRVYRGVNQVDSSVLTQVPYAMRAEDETGRGITILEDARREVELLAVQPTYKHLLSYVDKVNPYLNKRELRWLEDDLRRIEDGVLEGHNLRTELIYSQIGHNGGVVDSGLSPYLSASYDPKEALEYIRRDGALLIIDIPISKIEDFSSDSSETNIKGALKPEYITAVISRGNRDISEQDIEHAISGVSEAAKISVYDAIEAQRSRREQIAANKESDKQQWQADVEAVRQKRVTTLVTQFPELGLDMQTLQKTGVDAGTDIYIEARRRIFDFYADRFSKIGKRGRKTEDYDYQSDISHEARKSYDRNNITDEMLYKLREHVLYLERREGERSSR